MTTCVACTRWTWSLQNRTSSMSPTLCTSFTPFCRSVPLYFVSHPIHMAFLRTSRSDGLPRHARAFFYLNVFVCLSSYHLHSASLFSFTIFPFFSSILAINNHRPLPFLSPQAGTSDQAELSGFGTSRCAGGSRLPEMGRGRSERLEGGRIPGEQKADTGDVSVRAKRSNRGPGQRSRGGRGMAARTRLLEACLCDVRASDFDQVRGP